MYSEINTIVKVLYDGLALPSDQFQKINVAQAAGDIFLQRARLLSSCYYPGGELLFFDAQFIEDDGVSAFLTQLTFSVSAILFQDCPDEEEPVCYKCVIGDSVSRESRRRLDDFDPCEEFTDRGSYEEELKDIGVAAFQNVRASEVLDTLTCNLDYEACLNYRTSSDTCVSEQLGTRGCPDTCCCDFTDLEAEDSSSQNVCSAKCLDCDFEDDVLPIPISNPVDDRDSEDDGNSGNVGNEGGGNNGSGTQNDDEDGNNNGNEETEDEGEEEEDDEYWDDDYLLECEEDDYY